MRVFHQRKSPRLQGYDYAQAGAYFVTLCCHQRTSFFGHIMDGDMRLNETGELAAECWLAICNHFPSVDLDGWVIMPNHMHGILVLTADPVGTHHVGTRYSASTNSASTNTASTPLGHIINTYKGAVTRAARRHHDEPEWRLWQTRYHDHIIRNEADLNRIRQYIVTNPARWETDSLYS
ncbi:MAG: transposase [Anaerolineae bacterium]|nr:transposase [Anaerolineae bacterium]